MSDRQQGLAKSTEFADALREHGILTIDMGFADPSSSFILEVVEAMGCTAQAHSSKDGPLWDITWKPSGTAKDPTGKPTSNVWSHSLDEMSWHTDGSFEQHPMPFFGFHILHSDHEGGGRFRILKADEIAQNLSPRTWEILTTKEFDLRVPPEFMKKVGQVKGKLLRVDPDTGYIHLRYRSSVVKDPPCHDDDEANEAVRELQTLLHDAPDRIGQTISPNVFKDNSILLMDNARFLHSRTKVNDQKRHLRRVRFEGTPGMAEQVTN